MNRGDLEFENFLRKHKPEPSLINGFEKVKILSGILKQEPKYLRRTNPLKWAIAASVLLVCLGILFEAKLLVTPNDSVENESFILASYSIFYDEPEADFAQNDEL